MWSRPMPRSQAPLHYYEVSSQAAAAHFQTARKNLQNHQELCSDAFFSRVVGRNGVADVCAPGSLHLFRHAEFLGGSGAGPRND
jgi:hypothetical protein